MAPGKHHVSRVAAESRRVPAAGRPGGAGPVVGFLHGYRRQFPGAEDFLLVAGLKSPRYPSPLLDKLGVKPGARVALVAVPDADFRSQLAERTADVSTRARADCDLIFFGAGNLKALERLASLRRSIKP